MGVQALLLIGSLLSACTFERRAGPDAVDETPAAGVANGVSAPPPQMDLAETGALRTVALFRTSVATGDLSSALALVDRDATLVDAFAGAASEAATRGELLLELRRRHADGITLEVIDSAVAHLSEETALVLSLVAVLQEGGDGIGEEVGRLQETVFLVAGPEGWRIRHLHRSILTGDDGSEAGGANN